MPCPDLDNTIQNPLENERYPHPVVDSAPNAVISTDCEGKTTFADKVVNSVFGNSIREVVDKSIALLIPEICRGALSRMEVTEFG
jgi:hypothetical protein